MSKFAVCFKSQEACSSAGDVVTREDEEYWVILEQEGWVEATSSPVSFDSAPPKDIKLFSSEERAHSFMTRWKGHPWYCSPKSYEILEVEPVYEQRLKGYKIK
jgi:hypothetical protein